MKKLIFGIFILLLPIICFGQVVTTSVSYAQPTAGGSTYATLIADGNTKAVYIADATYLTLSGSDVIQWADSTGNNYDLDTLSIDFTDDIAFDTDSVYTFDASHAVLADTFTLDQPCTIYAVMSPQAAWSDNSTFWVGQNEPAGRFRQDIAADSVYAYSGNTVGPDTIPRYEKVIVRIVYNGTNSKIQINERTAVTGNVGTDDLDGLNLFGRPGGTNLSTVAFWKIIIRGVDDDDDDELVFVRQLNAQFSVY